MRKKATIWKPAESVVGSLGSHARKKAVSFEEAREKALGLLTHYVLR